MRQKEYMRNLPPREVLAGAACNPKIAYLFEPIGRTGSEGCPDDSIEEGHKRQAVAMMVCAGCPVRQSCFEDGIRHKRNGVYGGVAMSARYHRQRRIEDAA